MVSQKISADTILSDSKIKVVVCVESATKLFRELKNLAI